MQKRKQQPSNSRYNAAYCVPLRQSRGTFLQGGCNMKCKTTKRKTILLLVLTAIIALYFYWGNESIQVTHYEYQSNRLPKEFDGFVIAHISDLHNKKFGNEQRILLQKLSAENPDIIVMTGDMIDNTDMEHTMKFINGSTKIAQSFYVPGNHEAQSGTYNDLKEGMAAAGVISLENNQKTIQLDGSSISIAGIQDPLFFENTSSYFEALNRIYQNENTFQILLSHRPELIKSYGEIGFDIVFTGHAHGGQFRIPGLGGLAAPNQGMFPKYTSGSHTILNTTQYISRGLGNSTFPLRLGNRPEIVIVTLHH